jgi:hypothetical protein
MKLNKLGLITIVAAMWTLNVYAEHAPHSPQLEQINVQEVFVPEVGYDNNDNVQVLVDGKLPNLCYDLDKTTSSIDMDKKIITITQYARKKSDSICDLDRRDLPEYMKYPVRYSQDYNLGQLHSGKYKIVFSQQKKLNKSRPLEIKKAPVSSVDNFIYAPISSAFIPEIIYETNDAQVVLTGIMGSTCLKFSKIDVITMNDVYIILPKLTYNGNVECQNQPRPIQKIISLGKVEPGRYLIHIRSTSGKAINKVFSVTKRAETGNYSSYFDQ